MKYRQLWMTLKSIAHRYSNATVKLSRQMPGLSGTKMSSYKKIDILRCPADGSEMVAATVEIVHNVNAAIRAGRIQNYAGQLITEPIEGGLIRAAGDLLYPIVRGIPVLLRDEAINIESLKVGS